MKFDAIQSDMQKTKKQKKPKQNKKINKPKNQNNIKVNRKINILCKIIRLKKNPDIYTWYIYWDIY